MRHPATTKRTGAALAGQRRRMWLRVTGLREVSPGPNNDSSRWCFAPEWSGEDKGSGRRGVNG